MTFGQAVVARAGGAHGLSCGGQLQVPVWWQGLVSDIHLLVGVRASCKGPGCHCALLWLQDPSVGAVEAGVGSQIHSCRD